MPKKRSEQPHDLEYKERKEAYRRMAPKAAIVYEAIRCEGEIELDRNTAALIWSGVGAGLSMGFSFLMEALLTYYLPEAHWVPLLSKFGYCIGFLIVVLGRQQLFTENTLTAVLPLLSEWQSQTLIKMLRLWTVVLMANLAGALMFALLLLTLGHFDFHLYPELLKIAQKGGAAGFWETFFSAVLAGWLIALMVWLMPFAETGRVAIIIIITYLIGLGQFAHIIAGSVDAIFTVLATSTPIGWFFIGFFIPALTGNIIGGVTFVAILNYAQVVPDQSF